jgi:hypothetical protein
MSTKTKSTLPTQPVRMVSASIPLEPEVIINPIATVVNTETSITAPEAVKAVTASSIPVDTKKVSYEYKVIATRDNLDMFQLTVSQHLNSGWELSGGVSCTMYADSYSAATIWSQAIYKKTSN